MPFLWPPNRSRISIYRELIWDMPDQITAANRAAMAEGQAHHMAGRFAEAEAIYRRVLSVEPNNPDALHLLGVIEHRAGNTERVVELIGAAIAANPRVPAF